MLKLKCILFIGFKRQGIWGIIQRASRWFHRKMTVYWPLCLARYHDASHRKGYNKSAHSSLMKQTLTYHSARYKGGQ